MVTGLISTVYPMTLEWSWPLQTMALPSVELHIPDRDGNRADVVPG